METVKVFIGYDKHHPVAYHTLAASIIEQSSIPVSITGVRVEQIPEFTRNVERDVTEFKYSRFLVPHMCDFEGWAIFLDMDMLLNDDIAKLWAQRDDQYAVQVVKHHYKPHGIHPQKGGKARVNWSSMMLMNCSKLRDFTPKAVSENQYGWMHFFESINNEQIGALDLRWNFLITEYPDKPVDEISILHYTRGGPWVDKFRGERYPYVAEWDRWKRRATYTTNKWPR